MPHGSTEVARENERGASLQNSRMSRLGMFNLERYYPGNVYVTDTRRSIEQNT